MEIRLYKQRLRHLNNQLNDADSLPRFQLSVIFAEVKELHETVLKLTEQFEKLIEATD